MNGILVIDKEDGYTSHDVVAVIKGLIKEKHLGHTGTLDPNATGVLPVCIGPCTRLIEYMDKAPKTYVATARFGVSTDTQDIWGNTVAEKGYTHVSGEKLAETISKYIGDIEQTPSMYSAIKVKGRHLYSYARSGEKVEVPSRTVTVYGIKLLDFDEGSGVFSIEVVCGRGTYVRSICSDIGDDLGFGAVMTQLRRTSACGFSESDAISIDELKSLEYEELLEHILPAGKAVSFMNRVDIDEEQKKDFANGKHLKTQQGNMSFDEPVCVFYKDELCGIGIWDNPNRLKPEKVFVR